MRRFSDNPSTNTLPAGIKEQALIEAVQLSGYPLQGVIASKLQPEYRVVEEWGFLNESEEQRTLDLLAFKTLHLVDGAYSMPQVTLLIECKRSIHPFLFFQAVTGQSVPGFPTIAGYPSGGRIGLQEPGGKRVRVIPVTSVLGLDTLPFIHPGPPVCAAFSKGIAKGDKVEISGTDVYQGIILPLVTAHNYCVDLYAPGKGPEHVFPTLVLLICVLDAPMVLIESPEAAHDPIFAPWIRVKRQEANQDHKSPPSHSFYAIDFVHKDYFELVIRQALAPFIDQFAKRAIEGAHIIRYGGEVDNLDDWQREQIRMLPGR